MLAILNKFKRFSQYKSDILSGLTVSLALVPEAVAFALVAGVGPLVGLYAAFLVGLITSAIGGRPGMISGATGALAVVMVSLVAQHGVQYLFATVVVMGILQILAGILRLGKFIRLVPHSVMLGFVNGLAIVIFLAQLEQFKTIGMDGAKVWLSGEPLYLMLGLVVLTMAIIVLLPRLTKAVPSSLAAIIGVSLLVIGFNLDTLAVGDVASIAGSLPSFALPEVPVSWETVTIIFPYAVILAAIGLIESLLTISVIDEMTDTVGQNNRECVAQGLANTVTGCFGGMGGCAMIGQSMINVNSGGRGRLSGLVAAVMLLVFILFASSLIERIPLAALTGVMFMVVIGTFEWSSFRILRKIPKTDAFVLILVSVVTVWTDLAIGVIVGVIVSALAFAWSHAKHIRVDTLFNEEGSKVYELHGPLFFGSVSHFMALFDPKSDPEDVIVDFRYSRVCDHSGLEAIDTLAERYVKAGKKLHLRHLTDECRFLLSRAQGLVEVNVLEDPGYHLASDKLG
ncbi:MAG: SulP family inorganic anion transporter [Endozoicomonadaceae bacterium]|nr:SulP family inorganic anion transporter [Endozoicomonadaceae bacterium]